MSILLDVRGVCSRRRGMSRRVAWAAVVFVGVVAAASEVSVSRGGIARQPGLQTLGAGLAGWEFVTDPPTPIEQVCTVRPDGVVAVAGKPIGYLATKATYRDYRAHAEWRWSGQPGNGGLLVHVASGPKDRQWPTCFQVQWKHGAAGDLLPMAGATFSEPLSTPAGAKTPQLTRSGGDSERPVGEWNVCEVVCRGGAIEVWVNGVAQNRVTGASVAEGKVGFQLEGTPFELRHVTIDPRPRSGGVSRKRYN